MLWEHETKGSYGPALSGFYTTNISMIFFPEASFVILVGFSTELPRPHQILTATRYSLACFDNNYYLMKRIRDIKAVLTMIF
jgi:hypothetical protein